MIKLVTRKLCCKFMFSPGWSLSFLKKIKMKRYQAVMDRKEICGMIVKNSQFSQSLLTRCPAPSFYPTPKQDHHNPSSRGILLEKLKPLRGNQHRAVGAVILQRKPLDSASQEHQSSNVHSLPVLFRKIIGRKLLYQSCHEHYTAFLKYDKAITMKKQLWDRERNS